MKNTEQEEGDVLARRSTSYGVGKSIGGAVYVHRSYEHVFGDIVEQAKVHLPPDFEYSVVKLLDATKAVSFIECKDFDIVPEPTVGDVYTVQRDGTARLRRRLSDPYIYHHKWLLVMDEYDGFDVEASKRRSIRCNSLAGINRRKIGKRSYWVENVIPLLADSKD